MNTTRKIVTMLLALVMLLCLSISAYATDITINGGASGAEYAAYMLFSATEGENDSVAYTMNEKYADILKELAGVTETDANKANAAVISYIEKMSDDKKAVQDFANAVFKKIQEADPSIDADHTTSTDVFKALPAGYYLIAETALGNKLPEPDENGKYIYADTYSLIMLDTVGQEKIGITTKESTPRIEKEVYEVNDSTGEELWQEHADYDVGDIIPYRITGGLSGQYESYLNYWYQIVDTMDEGLEYNNTSLEVTVGGITVVKNGEAVAPFTNVVDVKYTDQSFTVTMNLKLVDEASELLTVTHNSKVIAEYTCTLTDKAVSGAPGNLNYAKIRYQNNPGINEDPDEETPPGETPVDINIVFTFDSIANKIDKNNKPLHGAGFTLYKWSNNQNDWVEFRGPITNVTTFEFRDLDQGIYKLVETAVPAGYNRADDIEFHIHPEYNTDKDPVSLESLTIVDKDGDALSNFSVYPDGSTEHSEDSYEFSTNIVNVQGKELPSTGGIGTTIFYIIGAALVLGAVVLLVTKKRMK